VKILLKLTCIVILGLLVAGGVLGADDDPKPSPCYHQDDVQYVPAGPDSEPTGTQTPNAILGDLLFTDVVSVHFVGPGHPTNPEGSLGGLVLGDFADWNHETIFD